MTKFIVMSLWMENANFQRHKGGPKLWCWIQYICTCCKHSQKQGEISSSYFQPVAYYHLCNNEKKTKKSPSKFQNTVLDKLWWNMWQDVGHDSIAFLQCNFWAPVLPDAHSWHLCDLRDLKQTAEVLQLITFVFSAVPQNWNTLKWKM